MFMRIKIYQIDRSRDERRLRFCDYQAAQAKGGVRASEYKCVFHGYVNDGDFTIVARVPFPHLALLRVDM